ncbi:MAG: hypothetical protein PHU14_16205 [Methylovulum sp.]|nr:hypothetical protein [Methylovulum sp.]
MGTRKPYRLRLTALDNGEHLRLIPVQPRIRAFGDGEAGVGDFFPDTVRHLFGSKAQ